MSIFGFDKYAAPMDLLQRAGWTQAASKRKEQLANPEAAPVAPTPAQPTPPKKLGLDDYYQTWKKAPNPENLGNILHAANPIISSGMMSYAKGDNPILRSKAKKLAISAVKSYDPQKATSLKSWITLNMQGLQRFAGATSPITAPERMRIEAFRVSQAKQEFEANIGREPSMDELADLVKLHPKRIAKLQRTVKPVLNEGMFTPSDGGDDDEGSVYSPGVVHSDWQKIWMDFVYSDLDPINKQLFDMRLGRGTYEGKQMSVDNMAKALGISAAAVSQRTKRIADKLAEGYDYEGRF